MALRATEARGFRAAAAGSDLGGWWWRWACAWVPEAVAARRERRERVWAADAVESVDGIVAWRACNGREGAACADAREGWGWVEGEGG